MMYLTSDFYQHMSNMLTGRLHMPVPDTRRAPTCPAAPTCGRSSTKCWVLSSTPTNHPQWVIFCHIHTPALADRPSFSLRVYLSRVVEAAFRRCLFEYIYNLSRPILDMHLQGTAHSSQEIELQGVMLWFLIKVGQEFWFESHHDSCVGDIKRYSVGKIRVVVCVVNCVECVQLVNPGAWGFLYPR